MPDTAPHIGTLREGPLHASLKRWYSEPRDRIEAPVDGSVIDLVRGDLLIEIQTRGFSSMKRKVDTLLGNGHRIRIVHPIAADRWIVKLDDDDNEISRRKSPKHGHPTDIFSELVSFPNLMTNPNLEIEVVMTTEDELRKHSPDKAWRRRGWTIVERHLIDVLDSIHLSTPSDLLGLLPETLPETFTTADLSACLGRPRRVAQQAAYCLRHCDAITPVGKQANAIEYRVALD